MGDYPASFTITTLHGTYILDVGRYTPNATVNGDMGWESQTVRQWKCILGPYFGCVNIDSARLSKRVFVWSYPTIPTLVPPIGFGRPCVDQWSAWLNTDTPDSGDGDRESWSCQEKDAFCPTGTITAVDCQTIDGIPVYNTCENVQCSIQNGSVCLKYSRSCSDYQIRYYCSTCSTCSFRIRPMSSIQIPEVSTRPPAVTAKRVTPAHQSLADTCNPLQLGVVVGLVSLIWFIIIIIITCVYFKVLRKK